MTAKEIVQKFYKSDALIDSTIHERFASWFKVEWNSSKGFSAWLWSLLNISDELGKAYVRSKYELAISKIIDQCSLFSFCKT
jgi:hypothetical protein